MSTMAAMSPLRVPSCPSTERGQLCSDGQVSSGRKLSVHVRHQYRQLPSPSLSQIGRGLSLHSSQRNLQNSAIIKIIFKRSRCSNTTNGPQFFGIIVGHKEGHVQNQNLSQKYAGRIGKSRAGHLQDQLVNWSWSTGPGQLVLVNWSTDPGQLVVVLVNWSTGQLVVVRIKHTRQDHPQARYVVRDLHAEAAQHNSLQGVRGHHQRSICVSSALVPPQDATLNSPALVA